MNNTKRTLTAIAAILMAATLVVGTLAATSVQQSAFAYQKKRGEARDKGSINGNTITTQKCKQAATQSGFDNDQEQECENLICTHPGDNAACIQEGPATKTKTTPTPIKLSCEECFTTVLNSTQITAFLHREGVSSIADACLILEIQLISESGLRKDLIPLGLPADELIACLKEAGIVFGR
jgi:hypothetical protein